MARTTGGRTHNCTRQTACHGPSAAPPHEAGQRAPAPAPAGRHGAHALAPRFGDASPAGLGLPHSGRVVVGADWLHPVPPVLLDPFGRLLLPPLPDHRQPLHVTCQLFLVNLLLLRLTLESLALLARELLRLRRLGTGMTLRHLLVRPGLGVGWRHHACLWVLGAGPVVARVRLILGGRRRHHPHVGILSRQAAGLVVLVLFLAGLLPPAALILLPAAHRSPSGCRG
mmetsp:Transcript_21434/g.69188  ORF Transcript_21434/g.69188 Transcript_21434/m.69188 type:complete len:227 (-) Transcript_21434:15-695(-)